MTDEDYAIAQAMHRFGGSFICALGALYKRADPENRRRLKVAFPEYFEAYRQVAAGLAARQAEKTTIVGNSHAHDSTAE